MKTKTTIRLSKNAVQILANFLKEQEGSNVCTMTRKFVPPVELIASDILPGSDLSEIDEIRKYHKKHHSTCHKQDNITYIPNVERVIYNEPATIVFFTDGTKTVVKCEEGDTYSKEAGLALAIAKKALGKRKFHKTFEKHLGE